MGVIAPSFVVLPNEQNMKRVVLILALVSMGSAAFSQEDEYRDKAYSDGIQTLFKSPHSYGGYGAITNRFTRINGSFTNMTGVYGGVFINHKVLIGMGGWATTNYIPVPEENSVSPGDRMSYAYGQFGLITEYALWSKRAVHLNFNLFSGAGFSLQYERPQNWYYDDNYHARPYGDNDENWMFVVEPGVQLEMNLFRWMRVAPGVSYRQAYGSYSKGLSDSKLSDITYSVTVKFGKF